jgi:hypothetical protein
VKESVGGDGRGGAARAVNWQLKSPELEQPPSSGDNPDMAPCFPRRALVAFAILMSSLTLFAFKEFVAPKPENATTYPSKDVHPMEKVAAAIDIYNTAPKDDIFVTHYVEEGILPVLLIITNSGDQPVSLTRMHAQMVTASRTKLDALEVDDVYRRVAHIKASSTSPGRVGPIPLPTGAKNKKAQEQYQELTRATFAARAVEPHTTQSGFLFFDIQNLKNPVVGSSIYLTGVRDNSGNELMYFEIPVIPSNAANP